MRVVVLGSTGMLGQALIKEANIRKIDVFGMADKNADFSFDIKDDKALSNFICKMQPDVVINTVAIINLDFCEEHPDLAYLVNARPVALLTNLCREVGSFFVHISTDHYFIREKDKKHKESDKVVLVNEYARTKHVAEVFALNYLNSLVLRTNIVGFRYQKDNSTFVEWAVDSLKNKREMTLFSDFYASSIDVRFFAKALFDLLEKKEKPVGLLNLASKEVSTKRDFIMCLAKKLNMDFSHTKTSKVSTLGRIKRAESLGLDVSKAEELLGYELPTMNEVVDNLVSEYLKVGL